METPLDRIRAATTPLHRRIETLAYSHAVLDGSLSLAVYASFLRATDMVHAALERAADRSAEAGIRSVLGDASPRRALLAQDLAYLGADPRRVDAAAREAQMLGQAMWVAAQHAPAKLLGHAYVLEGSQLGGLVQAIALRKRAELRDGGLLYLSGTGHTARSQFTQFITRLQLALGHGGLRSPEGADAASHETAILATIVGALDAFSGFERILRAVARSA